VGGLVARWRLNQLANQRNQLLLAEAFERPRRWGDALLGEDLAQLSFFQLAEAANLVLPAELLERFHCLLLEAALAQQRFHIGAAAEGCWSWGGDGGRGLTNQAIAESLAISLETVKTHVVNAKDKLGAADRTQLAVMTLLYGLIDPLG